MNRGIEMKRARLIYNPTAGREEIKKQLPDILEILESYDIETSCYQTKGAGDAAKAAIDAANRDFDIIISAGGDGTLNNIINGLSDLEKRPKLGIISAGTTNDFARALKIPKDFIKAAHIIGEQNSKAIDVGIYNDKYFINIAGGGSLTEITYEVPRIYKTILGQLAYYLRGIEKVVFLKPMDVTIEANNTIYKEESMLFLITNSNSVGGFEKLSPNGDISDGLFDVVIVKRTNIADFLRLLTLATRGEHLDDKYIISFQTDELKVYSNNNDEIQINLDGELGGTLPGEFKVLKHHIEIFIKE